MRPEDIVSTQEACKILQITRPTLYSWLAQGKIKYWGKLGAHHAWYFLRKEVMRVKANVGKYERSRVPRQVLMATNRF